MKSTSRVIQIISLTLAALVVAPCASSQAATPKAGGTCVTAYSATTFGGVRELAGTDGVRPTGAPTTPPVMPTISPKEQKAMSACKALAPAFGSGRGLPGGTGGIRPTGSPVTKQ